MDTKKQTNKKKNKQKNQPQDNMFYSQRILCFGRKFILLTIKKVSANLLLIFYMF